MAIGKAGNFGRRSGPMIGRKGKSAGKVGKRKVIHGSALTLDQNKTKVAYPTTTTV